MKKQQKEAILISFLNEKAKYQNLAEYIVHLIRDDPSSPKESLHAIIYRIKDASRLIEKINGLNRELEAGASAITQKNYQDSVGDLLGLRIICLRLSDVQKVEAYLRLLSEENILHFVKGPEQKQSFIPPAPSRGSVPDGTDLRYTGYSSIHYQIKLGENSDAPPELRGLLFELQLRTILEEAWSEIDHKYRYVHSRIGQDLPEHIHTGFYHLSAYLQVAALQAENLCCMTEACHLKESANVKRKEKVPGIDLISSMNKETASRELSPAGIERRLKEIFNFKVTPRTIAYIEKRIGDINSEEKSHKALQKLLSRNRLREFKTIFQEIFKVEPFVNEKDRNVDVINALNFGIFYELQGRRVAQEGLRAVLGWRKDRSIRQHSN